MAILPELKMTAESTKPYDVVRKTTCNNMCEALCGLVVFLKRVGEPKKFIQSGVEVDASLKIVDIYGDPEHPRNKGAICPKGTALLQHAYNPLRVKYPMIREDNINGRFRRVTWEEAIDFCARKLVEIREKYGPQALGCHRTGRSSFGHKMGASRFFLLFGSPNVYGQGPICCESPGTAGHYVFGAKEFLRSMNPVPDWINSKLIIMSGHNMAANHPVEMMWVLDAKEKNGAKFVVIDPRMNATASRADLYMQIRPNTDAALILTLINLILQWEAYDREFVSRWVKEGDLERLRAHVRNCTPEWAEKITWIPAEHIRRLALWIKEARPYICFTGGLGNAQTFNSNNINRAWQILAALVGCIGIPGGGWNWTHNCRPPLNPGNDVKALKRVTLPILTDKLVPWGDHSSPSMIDPMITGKPYPIKALIWNGNHLAQWPNVNKVRKAMRNLELVVHLAYHPNETAKYAHAVFPIGSMFEREGICHHGNDRHFQWHNKIIPFQWECRSDLDFWALLAKRVGELLGEDWAQYFPWFDEAGYIDEKKSTDFWCSQEPLTAGITHDVLNPETSPIGGVSWPARTREEAMQYEEVTDPISGRKIKALWRGTWIMYREDQKYPGTNKRFPTISGKVEFYSDLLKDLGWDPLPVHREASETPLSTPELAKKYPLILCTGRIVSSFHEMGHWWPWTAECEPHRWINIHPETAQRLGIKDGDTVIVENDRGRIEGPAWVTEMVHPDEVWIPEGFDIEQPFYPYDNVNVLIDDIIKDPVYGQVQYKATLVRVYKKE